MLLGPIANYLFLRCVGGDKQAEASQMERYRSRDANKYQQLTEWRKENNSFWSAFRDLCSPWTLAIAGCGFIGVMVEEGLRSASDS